MTNKFVFVVAMDETEAEDYDLDLHRGMEKLRVVFGEMPNTLVYGAVRESADAVLAVFDTQKAVESEPEVVEEAKTADSLRKELEKLLNRYSVDSAVGTPDWILAGYVVDSLKAYGNAIEKRAQWRGESDSLNRQMTAPLEGQ